MSRQRITVRDVGFTVLAEGKAEGKEPVAEYVRGFSSG
jgi:hypothetical protein